jgi:hypothetical protein
LDKAVRCFKKSGFNFFKDDSEMNEYQTAALSRFIRRIGADKMVFVETFQLIVPDAAGHRRHVVHIWRIDHCRHGSIDIAGLELVAAKRSVFVSTESRDTCSARTSASAWKREEASQNRLRLRPRVPQNGAGL